MKTVILLALIAFVAAEKEYYVLDKIDLSNVEEFKKYMDCLLERVPCSAVHESYRVLVPEAFRTACEKCTPEHKQFVVQFFDAVKKYIPQDHDVFLNKYDPENLYLDKLLAEVNKYKA